MKNERDFFYKESYFLQISVEFLNILKGQKNSNINSDFENLLSVLRSEIHTGWLPNNRNPYSSILEVQWCAYQNHNDPIYEVNDLFLTLGFTT